MDGGGAILRASARERLVPPAPLPPGHDLPLTEVAGRLRRNALTAWPASAYEDLVLRRRFLGKTCWVFNDPAAARHVLHERTDVFVRPPATRRLLRPGVGDGLLMAEGEAWRAQRRMLAPAFTPRQIDSIIPHLHDAARAMLTGLGSGGRANLAEALEHATIDAVGRAMFSTPLLGRAPSIARLARRYFRDLGRAQVWDFLADDERAFDWTQQERRDWSRLWFAEIDAIIARRQAGPPGPDRPPDVLALARAARDAETGEPLPEAAVRDQIATMMIAGFESTARILFWAAYLLSLDPAEQAAVRAEVAAFPPDRVSGMGDLKAWPRLTCVLMETMRLYPSVSATIRVARAAERVPGGEPDHPGADIARGDMVVIAPWLMHRHRRFWDRPEAFMPERFAGSAGPLREGPFIPFGIGRRVCIGASFSITEATLILAHLLHRFRLDLDDDRPVMPVATTTTIPSLEPWFQLHGDGAGHR